MRKFFKWVVILGILGGAGWVIYKWNRASGISSDALSLIPADAIYYIVTPDPVAMWKEISESAMWSHLQKNAYFAELSASANSLDSLVHENDLLFDLIGSRTLITSAHMIAPKEYDFLFLVDLKQVSGIKFINEYLTTFSAQGFSVLKEKFNNEDLLTLHNKMDNSNLYISFPGSYLVASFTKKIVTTVLDQDQSNRPTGQEVILTGNDLTTNGDVQLYLNYSMLPKLMTCYSQGSNEYVNRLSQALLTTNLNLSFEDNLIRATGYTCTNDSVESYIKTLTTSGKSATEFLEIAPNRTAFCLALGFSTFDEFFKNFEKNLQQDVGEYNNYKESLHQVESYLKISVQDNVIDWIGDEVALFELQSFGKGIDNEMAAVLKADNIEEARKDLDYIEKMVRRKTPVKFKAVEHRGYSISYLGMKGLFRILLGKFFARYDKPYYTIINNFVIFSNHPQTLESIIDDYLDKNTLIRSEEFRAFRKEFDDEGSAFIYINTPVLFNTLKKLADYQTQSDMETNKEYITCFRQVGFQLVPEDGRFKTIFAEQFVAPETEEPVLSEADLEIPEAVDTAVTEEHETAAEDSDPMELPYIYVRNLNTKLYTEYFPDSTMHYSVEIRNGFKNGEFTEFYPNGETKMTGTFENDKRDGVWRLYDENGKLLLRRRYSEGEVESERTRN